MSNSAAGKLPLRLKLFNGLGSVAYGVKDNGFSTFLLIFYNQVVGLDAWDVSKAIMLALLIDALVDPIIGHLSDRTYTRFGRRLPWLYLAPIPLALSWMLLWSPPNDHSHIFAYLVVTAILVRTLISCCEVPSQSLVAELTSDYDERTVLTRFRYLFGWGGGLLAFYLANTVFLKSDAAHEIGQLNGDGYWNYGLAGALMMAISVLVSAAGQHRRLARLPLVKPEKSGLTQMFREIFQSLRHPASVILFLSVLVSLCGTYTTYTISNYLYLYVWQFNEAAFAFLPVMLVTSVTTCFFTVSPLQKRFGKKALAIGAGVISNLFWLLPYLLRYLDLWPMAGSALSTAILCSMIFITNVTAVMVSITAQSMVADIVEASFLETGRRTEGVFTAGWVFVQKCGTALGMGITGLLISWSGLPQKAVPGQVDDHVIDHLILGYGLVILTVAIVSPLIFRRFPIGRADHEERLRQIAADSPN